MEQHGPGRVKYLHDLTATHVDADHVRKVLFFLPRLPQHIPIRQRSSLNLSSSPQAQPRPSGSGARRTSAHSTTVISTHRPSRPQGLKNPEISRIDILPAHQLQLSVYASSSHVYQTIFLDKGGSDELWTKDKIK